jgi:adenine phosphoribosyltransferase
MMDKLTYIKSHVRSIPDWPKAPIVFRDITTVLRDKKAFEFANDLFYERYKGMKIDLVVGIEARGFIFGAVLADRLGIGFVPIRKKGKLPPEVIGQSYELEYGSDTIEISSKSLNSGSKVIIIDDLLATGGTMLAACRLVEKLGASIVECTCMIDLPEVGGRKRLEEQGYKVYCQVAFEGH